MHSKKVLNEIMGLQWFRQHILQAWPGNAMACSAEIAPTGKRGIEYWADLGSTG